MTALVLQVTRSLASMATQLSPSRSPQPDRRSQDEGAQIHITRLTSRFSQPPIFSIRDFAGSSCIERPLASPSKWKARGYGNGQVLLLPDQNLLLILSEKGDVALVEARPDSHKEVARFKVFAGKTWNHPVIAHG